MPQHPDGDHQLPVAPAGAATSPSPAAARPVLRRTGAHHCHPADAAQHQRGTGPLAAQPGRRLAVVIGSFLTRTSHLERLRAVVDKMAPGGDANAISTSTGIVFWGSLSALLLLILLQAAFLAVSPGAGAGPAGC